METCAFLLLCLFSMVSLGASQDFSSAGGIDLYGDPAKYVSGLPLIQLSPETGLVPLDKVSKAYSTYLFEVHVDGSYVRKNYNVSKEEAFELWKASGDNVDVCCVCICEQVPYADAKRTSFIGGFSSYPERLMALLPSLWSWNTPFIN